MGGLDLGALFNSFAGGDEAEEEDVPSEPAPIHAVDGWIYFVGDAKVCERLRGSLKRQAPNGQEPASERIEHRGSPERWAVRPVANGGAKRLAWADRLVEAGLDMAAERLAPAVKRNDCTAGRSTTSSLTETGIGPRQTCAAAKSISTPTRTWFVSARWI